MEFFHFTVYAFVHSLKLVWPFKHYSLYLDTSYSIKANFLLFVQGWRCCGHCLGPSILCFCSIIILDPSLKALLDFSYHFMSQCLSSSASENFATGKCKEESKVVTFVHVNIFIWPAANATLLPTGASLSSFHYTQLDF